MEIFVACKFFFTKIFFSSLHKMFSSSLCRNAHSDETFENEMQVFFHFCCAILIEIVFVNSTN